MKHVKKECVDAECTGDCNVCSLFICSVCNCAECELATDCPGGPVSEINRELICAGHADFVNGKWVCK